MNLSEESIRRFYKIWFNLLDYTNAKYQIAPKIKDLAHSSNINPQDISPIRDRLWIDNTIVEEIVNMNPIQFSESDLIADLDSPSKSAAYFIYLNC